MISPQSKLTHKLTVDPHALLIQQQKNFVCAALELQNDLIEMESSSLFEKPKTKLNMTKAASHVVYTLSNGLKISLIFRCSFSMARSSFFGFVLLLLLRLSFDS